ncbi:hemin ABC transporter substrate-binding protein [Magnetospirillum sp. SS-4]|uniref:heme/hemin ABC transporter substrate-binding protein n=1 Tax=Magnetospirillum sp. SS-4 TaxID=2681465 RepID=UPI00137FFC27|nr:ABC transporter substrate-binding protein [Magnetospirillum sp. SS-4]CAA7620106.1 Periplasmic-binding protein [Magnetospirillum sp. SS-4]
MTRTIGHVILAALLSVAGTGPAMAADTVRLVVIGGSLTEIVFALGRGGSVVGVDQTSVWPPEVKSLPQVGYYKKVSAEGVLSLAPTLVMAYRDAEPAGALRQLEQAGVPVALFDRSPPMRALEGNIAEVGRLLGKTAEADTLRRSLDDQIAAVARSVTGAARKPRVLFVLNYDPSQTVVAGSGTIAGQLIEMAGGVNAAGDVTGFKPLNGEMVTAAAPDLVLTVEERWDGIGGAAGMARLPGMAATPAGRSGGFAAMPGPLMLGLGPRLGDALWRLAALFHGEKGLSHGR